MYAVIVSGSKQYKVKVGQIILVEKLKESKGKNVFFNQVLIFKNKEKYEIGQPFIKNVVVNGSVINHGRLKKTTIIKFNRRKHYKKKQGHRQLFTKVKIIKINTI